MKSVLGILSLLIVLAVLAFVAKRQLQSVAVVPSPNRIGASVPSGTNATGSGNVADQARALQDRARDQATRAVQQGADRAASADQ